MAILSLTFFKRFYVPGQLKMFSFVFGIWLIANSSLAQRPTAITNQSFSPGEVLRFRLRFSIFTVGRAIASVQSGITESSKQVCYVINLEAKTSGIANVVTDIENNYRSTVDTTSMLPYSFYRKQREGNYRVEEQTDFDQQKLKVAVRKKENRSGTWKQPEIYNSSAPVRDIISGLFFIRSLNLSDLAIGDTVKVAGFFEDEFYDMSIIFKGRRIIRTPFGRISTLVFYPFMPKNSIFEGGESISVYLSEDNNHIPLRIEAKMFIGSAGIELISYEGLRSPLLIIPKEEKL